MLRKAPFVFVVLLALLCELSSLSMSVEAQQAGNLRFTVIVHELENETHYKGRHELGRSWATILTSALHENGSFIVLGQADMRDVAMEEQAFGATGVTAQGKKTPPRGQLSPAQLIVKGAITHFVDGAQSKGGGINLGVVRLGKTKIKTEIHATVQLVDSATGQLIAARNFETEAVRKQLDVRGRDGNFSSEKEADVVGVMKLAMDDVVAWMESQLPNVPWRGSVVSVEDELVIINRGRREGVVQGEEFLVGESKVLRDPDTGEVLYEKVTELARLRADKVVEKVSICSVVSGDGSLLSKGMGVKRARDGMPVTLSDDGGEAVGNRR